MTGLTERGFEPQRGPAGDPPGPRAGTSAPAVPRASAADRTARTRVAVELVVFAALGALGTAQWSRLVVDPPLGRLFGALAIVTAAGALLAALGTRRPRSRATAPVAVAVACVATVTAIVVVGLPARLLAPPNWPELFDDLGSGLAGFEDTEMPYDTADVWLRLALLLFVPLLLGIAAALGFWPARRRTVLKVAALGVLVALYGVAVTLDSPGNELLWGVPVLVLIVAWLWAPGLGPRRAATALVVAAAAGAIALPIAARLDPEVAWWDYESWDWVGRDSEVTFDWNHSYGPLEWPDRGTTLLEVRSAAPLYWKASVLDRFDGFTWQRAQRADVLATTERSARRQTPGVGLPDRHREWLPQASFEIQALTSGLVIGTGTPQAVQGLGDDVAVSSDGTLRVAQDSLQSGDEYSIVAYSPKPTAAELRDAPSRYPQRRFGQSTLVGLPATVGPVADAGPASSTAGPGGAVGDAGLDGGFAPARARAMPLWGGRPDTQLRAELLASPYASTYRLARRLVSGAGTPYAAVLAIQRHLRDGYDYSPNVPQHTYPLASFLFEDRSGYCQHFAGTMGLMLRMVGIPSRVVSGFAPGSLDNERGVYEVRDTDAHSWVEVYFRGIGWVTFDPTPAAAPAASQSVNSELGTFFRGRGSVADQGRGRGRGLERALEGGTVGAGGDDGGRWGPVGLVMVVIAAIAGGLAALLFRRRRRAVEDGSAAEAQIAELRRALGRLGWKLPPEITLLGVERRFRTGRPAVAGYAARLRAHRYAPGSPPPPGPHARRAVRGALGAGGGLRRRLRAVAAIPPGGPR